MADKKGLLEIVLMPLAIAGGSFFISIQQQNNAETMASADRQVKILEIFSEQITSSVVSEQILFRAL